MNFLVPLYLLGAAAIAIPIYLHLRRKPPKDTVDFSSLMFLRATRHQPLKRRSQLENVPLLLLRCLALLALAAMFGRPFLPGGEQEGLSGHKRRVILLDTSASMRRGDLWEKARDAAEKHIRSARPDEGLAIITAGQSPRTVVSFQDWNSGTPAHRKEVAVAALADLKPTWSGSDLGTGLLAAAELIADASGDHEAARPSEIVLISDLQRGAAFGTVAEAVWPPGVEVVLEAIDVEDGTNATILAAPGSDPGHPTVRVRNDPASGTSRFEVRAGDTTLTAIVPPGESRVFHLEEPAAEVVLGGDGHAFDNRLFLAPRSPASVTLLFLGAQAPDDSNGPEYYFRSAFGPSEVLQPRFVEDLSERPAILAIGRPLESGEIREAREHLDGGGTALLVLTSTRMSETLAALAGFSARSALREHEGRYTLLERIDFEHPALRQFRDPRWRNFTDVHFWKHRVLDPAGLPDGSKVFAWFDNGDPAWISIPAGKGTLLVMTSGWHPHDSQLSLSSKFVPLLFSIFSGRGPQVGGVRQTFVGEALPLDPDERELRLPGGKSLTLAEAEIFRPSEPGVYRATGESRERAFAVNLRPSESDLGPLGPEPLTALGVPVVREGTELAATPDGQEKRRLRSKEAEADQKLWRWALVLLLAMLVVESLLASRTGSADLQPEGATS